MDTKQQITSTAFQHFLQKGYKSASLKDIVQELNLTKGAFYHHFKSKEELFREVVKTYMVKIGKDSFKTLDQSSLNMFMSGYLYNIQQVYEAFTKQNSQRNLTINYFYLAFDALRTIDDFDESINEMHKEERTVWANVIQNAKNSGEIQTNIPNKQLAKMFIAINDGVVIQLALQSKFEDNYEEIQTLWDSLYNLIKKEN